MSSLLIIVPALHTCGLIAQKLETDYLDITNTYADIIKNTKDFTLIKAFNHYLNAIRFKIFQKMSTRRGKPKFCLKHTGSKHM